MPDFNTMWPERTFRNKKGRMFVIDDTDLAFFMQPIRSRGDITTVKIQLLVGPNKRIEQRYVYVVPSPDTGKPQEPENVILQRAADWVMPMAANHLEYQAYCFDNMRQALREQIEKN